MAKPVYRLLKDNDLRALLRNLGVSESRDEQNQQPTLTPLPPQLPVNGNRHDLVTRHEEYVLLYNAQCDAPQPMPPAELVTVVLRRETQRQQAASLAPKAERDCFRSLIRELRQRTKIRRPKPGRWLQRHHGVAAVTAPVTDDF